MNYTAEDWPFGGAVLIRRKTSAFITSRTIKKMRRCMDLVRMTTGNIIAQARRYVQYTPKFLCKF
jgi:hypothetical protein